MPTQNGKFAPFGEQKERFCLWDESVWERSADHHLAVSKQKSLPVVFNMGGDNLANLI